MSCHCCHLSTHLSTYRVLTPAQFVQMFAPIMGDCDDNDLHQNASTAFLSKFYVNFLGWVDIMAKLGVMSMYGKCPDMLFELFVKTGHMSVAVGSGRQILNILLHRMCGCCYPSWQCLSTQNSRSSSGYTGKHPTSTQANLMSVLLCRLTMQISSMPVPFPLLHALLTVPCSCN